jgi:hypothetical protein
MIPGALVDLEAQLDPLAFAKAEAAVIVEFPQVKFLGSFKGALRTEVAVDAMNGRAAFVVEAGRRKSRYRRGLCWARPRGMTSFASMCNTRRVFTDHITR